MDKDVPCPICERAMLGYRIARDLYVCPSCGAAFTVLSTEHTHIDYDGGPPREVRDG